jgi:hypothetical protein
MMVIPVRGFEGAQEGLRYLSPNGVFVPQPERSSCAFVVIRDHVFCVYIVIRDHVFCVFVFIRGNV